MEPRDKYINECMDKKEKELLRQKELMSGLKSDKRTLYAEGGFRNADKTGYDNPNVGNCWKEYWQIFAQVEFPVIWPFCGKPFAKGDVSGCHINFCKYKLFEEETAGEYEYDYKKHIVPGHQDCNLKYNDEFISEISVMAVEAIAK